jgi:hypothetical protein
MNATLPIKNNILVYKGEVHKGNGSILVYKGEVHKGNGSIVQTSRIHPRNKEMPVKLFKHQSSCIV